MDIDSDARTSLSETMLFLAELGAATLGSGIFDPASPSTPEAADVAPMAE